MNNMNNTPAKRTQTSRPNQPIASFVQEADNLYTWCLQDIKALEPVGISAEMREELRLRAVACREAHLYNIPSGVTQLHCI